MVIDLFQCCPKHSGQFVSFHTITTDYTLLQNYVHIGLKQNLLRSITIDIITRFLENPAFRIHVVGRFSKDFSELHGYRSRGFQL